MDVVLKRQLHIALLELLELDNGRRTLTQCPGIEALAKAIEAAKKRRADEAHAENFGGSPHA